MVIFKFFCFHVSCKVLVTKTQLFCKSTSKTLKMSLFLYRQVIQTYWIVQFSLQYPQIMNYSPLKIICYCFMFAFYLNSYIQTHSNGVLSFAGGLYTGCGKLLEQTDVSLVAVCTRRDLLLIKPETCQNKYFHVKLK